MAKSVKLADIAAVLKVSTVTVSKALSDQKGVSEEMREKIKNLAKEMGYKSPSAVKQSKNKKSYNVGVLIAERHFNHYESYYLQVYQMVATRAVSKECFTMLEIINLKDEQEGRMPRLLQEDKVDGLIIIGLMKADYLARLKQFIKVPFVFLDFYDKENDCDAVIADSFYGMYKMTNYLFDQGHKKIAYVGTLLYTDSITDRYLGYCKSLLEHGQTARADWIIDDRSMETGDVRSGEALRLPKEMPTAFACNCDLTAGVLVEALRREGYRVPEDVSVAGFDNYLYPSICSLGITTYEIDIKEMARRTINKLIKKMSGENYKPGIFIVDGHMVVKESVKRVDD
ncbi:MAG: LacI family DNA-binding transcriptional regulator [Lachnospiraceae bacterium]|nr:LacI family DNA-binding transcriptional regulator [Lachnospiraceae bacterium]